MQLSEAARLMAEFGEAYAQGNVECFDHSRLLLTYRRGSEVLCPGLRSVTEPT